MLPLKCVGGEVGEGILGDGYPGDVAGCEPPFEALRCDEERTALSAALDGSKAVSMSERSGMLCCRCVGEAFFGVEPRKSFFVENFRESPPD